MLFLSLRLDIQVLVYQQLGASVAAQRGNSRCWTASGPFDSLPLMYCTASDPFDPLLKPQPSASDRYDTLPAVVACGGCRRRPVEVPNEVVAPVVTHFRLSESPALVIYFSNTTMQLQYKSSTCFSCSQLGNSVCQKLKTCPLTKNKL